MGNWFLDGVATFGNAAQSYFTKPLNYIAPGLGSLLDYADINGAKAAQKQFENQTYLDNSARAFNSQEAQKQRDWEQMMSNTQVQRGVADIKAAGLNPWLSIQNSGIAGNVPSGSSASSSSGGASQANNKLVIAAGLIATALRMFMTKGK